MQRLLVSGWEAHCQAEPQASMGSGAFFPDGCGQHGAWGCGLRREGVQRPCARGHWAAGTASWAPGGEQPHSTPSEVFSSR